MTPKEKAEEILSNYSFVEYDQNNGVKIHNDTLHAAKKQCAIICVEQIIEAAEKFDEDVANMYGGWMWSESYWQEVLSHLKNL